MSDVAVAWAKAQDCPTRPSKALLTFMASYANAVGEGWAAVEILALELQVDARSVRRGLAELREVGLLVDTGKWETWEGKRYPIFRLPVEKGFANTAQKVRAIRAAAREGATADLTLVSPQAQASPDASVTPGSEPSDSSVTPRPDSSVTQIGKGIGKGSAYALPEPARAGFDEAFEEAFSAYEARGQDRTHRPIAQRLFAAMLAEVGREAAVGAVRRYVAGDADLRRGDYGAPAFETWLEAERWRRWLPVQPPASEARTAFGPELPGELAGALEAIGGVAAYLHRATWCEAERTLVAWTATARDRLVERIGRRRLGELQINVAWRAEHGGLGDAA